MPAEREREASGETAKSDLSAVCLTTMPTAPKLGARRTAVTVADDKDGKAKTDAGPTLTALANISSTMSLDDMLSGLEKVGATGGSSRGEDSEHGGSASRRSRRSGGHTSIITRGTSASRIDYILDGDIRKQAGMEAKSYGARHPSGAASEAARRARATADAVKDAASRVAAYQQRVASNPYAAQALTSVASPPRPHALESERSSSSPPRPRSPGASQHGGGALPETPRSGRPLSAHTPRSSGGRSQSPGRSPGSPREPRATPLGSVYVGPRTEGRSAIKPRSLPGLVEPF